MTAQAQPLPAVLPGEDPVRGEASARSDAPPRERLLRAATELFCRHGIHAVGVDAVVAAAGTAKATLYKLFGSKERLVETVLEAEGQAWRDWFLGGLEAGEASPRERLDRIFPLLAEWFRDERFYGCPFINAVGEHDKRDDRVRNLTLAHKRQVAARLRALLAEAGAPDPDALVHEVGLLIDGAIVTALVTRDPEVGAVGARALASLLDNALPGAAPRRRKRA
ncbi:TetR/AcrR family transcriptional regulator [Methylobacterium nonmethylotrophicum]|uniref:TetR/AcrR family transcriptional regulator n=1 Tax=Methylobacterium nonmethylotrophicum TaxID=1141884 RepID=UPI001FE0399A|nr:TetR family transcriptional regulator [Methylobacterium nonmethylotrophicum]